MKSLSPSAWTFLMRALFSASVVYLGVAILVIRPTHWFGLAHCAWATVCVFGSWRAFQVAKRREAQRSAEASRVG